MNGRNAQYVKLFHFVRSDLHIKLNNTILILKIIPETFKKILLLWAKHILSVQTDLILLEYIQNTTTL